MKTSFSNLIPTLNDVPITGVADGSDAQKTNFEKWWYEIGSGIPPEKGEDQHEHVKRVSMLAFNAAKEINQ
jgi:hypothetical protein